MVKFWNSDFSIGKSENSGFLETIAACDLNIGRGNQLDELIKVSIQGQGHFLTLAQGHLYIKITTCFSQKRLHLFDQTLYLSFK